MASVSSRTRSNKSKNHFSLLSGLIPKKTKRRRMPPKPYDIVFDLDSSSSEIQGERVTKMDDSAAASPSTSEGETDSDSDHPGFICLGECEEEQIQAEEGSKQDLNTLEEINDYDDVHRSDTQPRVRAKVFPSKVEEPESAKELDMLWEEMDTLLRFEETASQVGNIRANEASPSKESACKHDLYLDEEIGIYCKLCYWIATEIKDVTPPFVSMDL